jgi:hypothetical protein
MKTIAAKRKGKWSMIERCVDKHVWLPIYFVDWKKNN